MDINGQTRLPPRKSSSDPSCNRYLSPHPNVQPSETTADDELNEDDIFAIDLSPSNDRQRHNSNNNSSINNNSHNNKKTSNFSESFGILAALPESPTQSHCYHKASISATRRIPSIPKPQQERLAFRKYQYQSAPVNVPMLTSVMKKNERWFHDLDDDDEEAEGEAVPPHETVARTHSAVVARSVMEGVGRTLKGRDQTQVRNAVWRKMGYLD